MIRDKGEGEAGLESGLHSWRLDDFRPSACVGSRRFSQHPTIETREGGHDIHQRSCGARRMYAGIREREWPPPSMAEIRDGHESSVERVGCAHLSHHTNTDKAAAIVLRSVVGRNLYL